MVERPHFAEVFTVASSSGGCGKTFYATNLACYLAAQTGQRVCLVDLDLQFGEVSTALHLRPRFTISDLLSREPVDEDDLDEHVEEYLEEHELGFSVLAAPFSPADADMIAPKDVYKVMGALRRHFDYIVVDTPAQLSEIVLAAFDHSTRVLCMVTLDLPSIRNMRVFLTTLEKLRISSESIGVVLEQGRGRHRHRHQRCAGSARQQDHLDAPVLAGGHAVDQQGQAGSGVGRQLRNRQEARRKHAAVRRRARYARSSGAARTPPSWETGAALLEAPHGRVADTRCPNSRGPDRHESFRRLNSPDGATPGAPRRRRSRPARGPQPRPGRTRQGGSADAAATSDGPDHGQRPVVPIEGKGAGQGPGRGRTQSGQSLA